MKNEELEILHKAYLCLYSEDINDIAKALEDIYIKYTQKKKEASEKSNKWNKSHIEQHRKHNRDYIKRKREVK